MVAREYFTGRELRLWQDELRARRAAPFPVDRSALFVAYYASAELGCFLALGWPLPEAVLDLYVEFRAQTNGLPTPSGAGLLGALAYHGLDSMTSEAKDEMRDLVLRGGPWSADERQAVLDYCATDVGGALGPLAEDAAVGADARRDTAPGARAGAASGPIHGRGRSDGAQGVCR